MPTPTANAFRFATKMTMEPFVTTTSGMRGWFAVLMWWNPAQREKLVDDWVQDEFDREVYPCWKIVP